MNEKQLHTPGPWQSAWDTEDNGLPEDNEWLIRNAAGELVVYSTWYDGPRLACTEADARLIAAAPDLLAALRDLVAEATGTDSFDHLGAGPDCDCYRCSVLNTARATITRAEGGGA